MQLDSVRKVNVLFAKARFLYFCLWCLFLCSASPQTAFCQVLDEFSAKYKSVLEGMNIAPEMVPNIQEKANKGDAQSQYFLAWLYFPGQSVEKNNAQAVQWMTKAANQDYKFAQTQLGLMYLSAKDSPENYVPARGWLVKG